MPVISVSLWETSAHHSLKSQVLPLVHLPMARPALDRTCVASPRFTSQGPAADCGHCMQGFAGVDYSTGARGSSGPVQFERQQEQDPFGLDKYANEVRAGRKNALDGIGAGGGAVPTPASVPLQILHSSAADMRTHLNPARLSKYGRE